MQTTATRESRTPVPGLPDAGEHEGPGPYALVIEPSCRSIVALPHRGRLLIGRSEVADLRIGDESVSREHAMLEVGAGAARILDLDSQNGTWVGGERIQGERGLRSGEWMALGASMVLLHLPRPDSRAPAVASQAVHRIGDLAVIVADPEMQRVHALLERLAGSELPVLITGETGTGKEVAARLLHASSPRGQGPFLALNCAALPDSLLESELFGHEKGAFSGAVGAKPGLLEMARQGTVFLDEIGELSAAAQAKLLRVIETRRITRIGDVRERAIDVRLVAATHRDLPGEVEAGRFRRDLYFRLSGATVRLPPLRERHRELALLARSFLATACRSLGRPAIELGDDALDALTTHAWPGNVRELKNVMEYVAATCAGSMVSGHELRARLGGDHVPTRCERPAAAGARRPLADEVRELEIRQIRAALAATGGNKTRAAELIGVPLRTFLSKLKRYRIAWPPPEGSA